MSKKFLNEKQQAAVKHGEGPLLIIAGAGTGKTTVITERIKNLLSSNKAAPGEILALTFTEKASREMEERIDLEMPYGYTQMWIMTFHGFCDRLLRDEAIHIGLNPAFKLLTEADATSLLHKNMFNLDLDYFRPLGNPTKFISGLLQHFSRLKDEDISPGEYLTWAKNQKTKLKNRKSDDPEVLEAKKFSELSHAFQAYEDLKIKKGVMDFADLISNALKLFRTRPNILANYQKKFKYILVDEFQDTNYAQNQLIVLLSGKNPNLTVVGDDDQSVYKWRGAAVSNILQFKSFYPQAKVVVLTQNYRSTQEILDRAYGLIQYNNPNRLEIKEKIDKKLVATRPNQGAEVKFIHADRVENEADSVAIRISELVNSQTDPLSFKDIAILVRANAHADAFIRALTRRGIPYQFLGPGQLFRQPEIKDVTAYLRILSNLEDNQSFYRVISSDYFNFPARDLAVLTSFAKNNNLHLFEACERISGQSQIPDPRATLPDIIPATKEIIASLIGIIYRHLALVPKETAGQILFYFLQDTGMLQKILDYKHPLDEKRAQNLMKFFNKLKNFEVVHEDASVSAVTDWIELSLDLGESPLAGDTDWTQNDAVNILTIHSAKGLEFKAVFLVNLVSQRFPSTQRREQIPIPDQLVKEILPEGDYHLEEERRLFYVGMTRARDYLFLTSADYYGEGKREKKLSPFIFEALGRESNPKLTTGETGDPQLSLLDWQKHEAIKSEIARADPWVINRLSYSQIQSFLDCPLHYKAKYILNIPSPSSASLNFGNVIHASLRDFYQLLKSSGKKFKGDPLKILQDIYAKNWTSKGYANKSHENKFFEKGSRFLSEYIKFQFTPADLPLCIEQSFSLPLTTAGKSLKISGKIDRVDSLPGNKIEIIDYKTGADVPTQKEVDTNLQLSFYALAATLIKEPPFDKKPEDVVLSLYYFDTQKKISTIQSGSQLEKSTEKIFEIVSKIESSDFICNNSLHCRNCEYKMLCDFK